MGYRQLHQYKQYAREVNAVVSNMFEQIGIRLIDFKIEFGTTSDGTVVVADEISPDGCRLLADGDKSMDKDLFRKDEGDIIQAYSSILESLKNNVK